MAFFDNLIIDADAPSYVKANLSWEALANHAIAAKKAKYRLAIEDACGSFIPSVCFTYGTLHGEYAAYLKQLVCPLVGKWEKQFSVVMTWVHAVIALV